MKLYLNSLRTVALAGLIALSALLAACYSPLQTEQKGLVIPLGFLRSQDAPQEDQGWVIDVYVYAASNVSIDSNYVESVDIKGGAQPIPIAGKPYHRLVVGAADWLYVGSGYDNRTAEVGAIPAGGPYAMHVIVWNSGNLWDEYVTARWEGDDGYRLVTFSISPGGTTVLSDQDILMVGAH